MENPMATRPLAFGIKLRDRSRGKTVRVHGSRGRYTVEDEHASGIRRQRAHPSLGDAIRDAASAWRRRLH
jgi:hypothetical protein